MAYQIHIRPSGEFEDDESWKRVVEETEGTRLAVSDVVTVTNPATGETIRVKSGPLDAEIYFPEEQEWKRALFWARGVASINARFEIGDVKDPAWKVIVTLAKKLKGTVEGDDGEVYEIH